jgi:hypothetical protein
VRILAILHFYSFVWSLFQIHGPFSSSPTTSFANILPDPECKIERADDDDDDDGFKDYDDEDNMDGLVVHQPIPSTLPAAQSSHRPIHVQHTDCISSAEPHMIESSPMPTFAMAGFGPRPMGDIQISQEGRIPRSACSVPPTSSPFQLSSSQVASSFTALPQFGQQILVPGM